jgi:hypothetical protein
MIAQPQPLFDLGQTVATPAALDALAVSGQSPSEFLSRHVRGDWGDLSKADKAANDRALTLGERILSAYRTSQGTRVWVITEADRSTTTILLPQEY